MDFIGGWTDTTHVDDYLARWVSPIPADGVFVYGTTADGHDGTVQIDAIIASAAVAPEPATPVLFGAGAFGLLGFGWRQRIVARLS